MFLEGFNEILEQTKKIHWPKKPKFIFTSNSCDTNELFKVWAAPKIVEGCPYIIGQHGNTYGMDRFETPYNEEQVSDIFVTWGWEKDGTNKYIPLFNLKQPLKPNKLIHDHDGNLLLIQMQKSHCLTWDESYKREYYFQNQKVICTSFGSKNQIQNTRTSES